MTISFTMLSDGPSNQPAPAPVGAIDAKLWPLLAGARARGVSDALDLLGLNAVLLDEVGMVLHINAGARAFLGHDLALRNDHLIVSDHDTNRALHQLIGASLGDLPQPGEMLIAATPKDHQIRLRVIPVPPQGRDHCQLLKALVLIS